MKIPQMQIHTTDAQLALTIQQPIQEIKQPPADMTIKQPPAELSIQVTEGQLQLDQTQLRADLGMYTFTEFARKAAQKGVQDILSGIARRAREGEQLGDIANGNNALSAIAASRNKNMEQKKLGIKFIPSYNAVKINITPSNVEINVQTNEPKINAKINKPIHRYTPGKVSVDLVQKPSVKIDWIL